MDKTIIKKNRITKFMLMVFIGMTLMVQAFAFLADSKIQNNSISSVVHLTPTHSRELIVVVHGLMRTSMSMNSLKYFLEKQGYPVYSYSYPSAKYTIHDHGIYLRHYIENLLVKNPGVKINFITHSLGGIIVREALGKLTPKQLKKIGCLIMLAPPNQGSVLAKLSTKMLPMIKTVIKPLGELSSDQESYVHRVPVPKIKIGIIAGRFDAKVPPASAYLQGQPEPVVINTNHMFIMNNAKTRKLIMNFLEKGTFEG